MEDCLGFVCMILSTWGALLDMLLSKIKMIVYFIEMTAFSCVWQCLHVTPAPGSVGGVEAEAEAFKTSPVYISSSRPAGATGRP